MRCSTAATSWMPCVIASTPPRRARCSAGARSRRREEHVEPALVDQRTVASRVARISLEVLGGSELPRVDEDRDDDELRAFAAGGVDQREMAFVQETHRRDESDGAARDSLAH